MRRNLSKGFAPIILLIVIFVIAAGLGVTYLSNQGGKLGLYPKCPGNLSGILTYPLIKPENLSAIIPLGNISPPGHTSPADHNYFSSDSVEKVPIYAPVDSWVTNITVISAKDNSGIGRAG